MTCLSQNSIASTRKDYTCDGCGGELPKGSSAVRWTGLSEDRDLFSLVFHPECREAEIAWNHHLGTFADEWQSLLYKREPDDDAWLLANYPMVAARLNIMRIP